jgi:hypothetical protein
MAIDINSYLANDETIVASYEKKKNKYYATDRRLIFTQKKHLEDAAYNHITKISMDKVSHKALIAVGIILFLLGLAVQLIDSSSSAGIGILVIGIIFIVLFFILRGSVYTIKLSSGDVIPVPITKSSNVEAFIKAIRDKMR